MSTLGPFNEQEQTPTGRRTEVACRVCLKRWDLDYDSMLQVLIIPPLTIPHEYLKLTTMYNIIHGHSHFPSGLFAHSNFPYSSNRSLNFTRPFAHTNRLYHSFVPGVIGLWNNLLHSLKAMPSISTLKGLYCIIFTMQVHVRH